MTLAQLNSSRLISLNFSHNPILHLCTHVILLIALLCRSSSPAGHRCTEKLGQGHIPATDIASAVSWQTVPSHRNAPAWVCASSPRAAVAYIRIHASAILSITPQPRITSPTTPTSRTPPTARDLSRNIPALVFSTIPKFQQVMCGAEARKQQ